MSATGTVVHRGRRPIRLAAYAPSPVYYRSGLYRRIAADPRIDFTAVFSSSAGVRPGDLGYGRPVAFDADALTGFRSVFLRRANRAEPRGAFLDLCDLDVVGAIRRGRFDALWLHGYYSATHLLAAATQAASGRALLVREEQTLQSPRPAWKRMLKQPLLRALFSRSHGLFIGRNNLEWFLRHGMPPERLFHVPFCVDNDSLLAESERLRGSAAALRAGFGIGPDEGPVVVTVSRLVPKKQPLVLLEAFRRARAERRCALLVAGTGPCEDELREFVRTQRIPDVHFAGFLDQSEIARAYAAADVFALASGWDETWGLVVNEAMLFGLPVVVSDRVGCADDLVGEGDNGYVVDHRSPAALASRLGALVDDAELRRRLGRRSRERIAEWNYDAAADGLTAALRAAVGEHRWRQACVDGARHARATEDV